jgi:hypothetical protein
MSDAQVPAGWYADPSGDISKQRYWDGTQWTDQYQDMPPATQSGAYAPPPAGYTQPTYTQPAYGAAPVSQGLTGGAKFGMFALGFFLFAIGVLIAWLIYKDKPESKDAIKFSLIGLAAEIVLGCICSILYYVLILGLAGAL